VRAARIGDFDSAAITRRYSVFVGIAVSGQ